jgi:hypothetical protein
MMTKKKKSGCIFLSLSSSKNGSWCHQRFQEEKYAKLHKETVKNMVTSLELIDTDLLARVHQKEY